jgi:hypothetical protein
MLKRKVVLLMMLLLIVECAHSQSKKANGYVITIAGEKLFGKILDGDWKVSQREVRFLDTISSRETIFNTATIREFHLSSSKTTFLSKRVVVREPLPHAVKLGENPYQAIDTAAFFIERIFSGELFNLYRFIDPREQYHFYLEKDSVLMELLNPSYPVMKGERVYRFNDPVYRTQLKSALSDWPDINIIAINYHEKSLVSLLGKYHKYKRSEFTVVSGSNKSRARFMLGVSAGRSQFQHEVYTTLAGGLQILLPRKFNNRFFYMELGRRSFGGYGGGYFGTGKFQVGLYSGISLDNGFLDTGVVFAFNKSVAITAHSGVFNLVKGKENVGFALRVFPKLNSD